MQTRTLFALIAVPALLIAGVAAAQTTNETARAEVRASSSNDAASWKMQIAPSEAWVAPGGTATYGILLNARADITVKLSIMKITEGATAVLSSETIDVLPGGSSTVKLALTPPKEGSRSPYVVVINGVSETGEHHDARAAVYVRDQPTTTTTRPTPPPTSDRPHAEPAKPANPPAPHPYDEQRIVELETRLRAMRHEIDAHLNALQAARHEATDRPLPNSTGGLRLGLSNELTYVGAQGGRIAVLLQNEGPDTVAHLDLRFNESAGWRAALSDTELKMPAHSRTWTFIHVQPSAVAAEPLTFGLMANGAPSSTVGKVVLAAEASTRMS